MPMTTAADAQLTTAERRNLSPKRPDRPEKIADRSIRNPPPPPRLFAFRPPPPGRRLISIMVVASGRKSGDLAEGEPDGQHQQRGDLIGDERIESVVTHLYVLQGVGLLHGKAKTVAEHLCHARDAGAAAAREERANLTRRARRGREERH